MLTPDYIRCGSRVIIVTWSRLLVVAGLVAVLALVGGPPADAPPRGGPPPPPSPVDAALAHDVGGGASALWRAAAAVAARMSGRAPRARRRAAPLTGLMRSWCTPRASTHYLEKWRPAVLGAPGWPVPSPAPGVVPSPAIGSVGAPPCDWLDATSTKVPFAMCTFAREEDTQVSAYIHREGVWNAYRKSLVEDMLPVLDSEAAWHAADGRTLCIDVGANIGFYTTLFATRGYDVISIEPARESNIMHLRTLERNGIHVPPHDNAAAVVRQVEPFASLEAGVGGGTKGAAVGGGARGVAALGGGSGGGSAPAPPPRGKAKGPLGAMERQNAAAAAAARHAKVPLVGYAAPAAPAVSASPSSLPVPVAVEGGGNSSSQIRKPTVWLYQNGASDSYTSMSLNWVPSNPGASWLLPEGAGPAIVSVPLDDLLITGSRDPNTPPLDAQAAPAIDPQRVRLIKISAEAMDARALHGMRRLLSLGNIPFLTVVLNDAHVKGQGCDPGELVNTLVDHGYRLWNLGVFFERPADVARFIKGTTQTPPRSLELLFVGRGVEWS